jgi:hypothetical protein
MASQFSAKAIVGISVLPFVLGIMMIVSGSLTVKEDKDLTKPLVAYQSALVVFGCIGVIFGLVLMVMGFVRMAKGSGPLEVGFGGRNALGARRSWYPDMM